MVERQKCSNPTPLVGIKYKVTKRATEGDDNEPLNCMGDALIWIWCGGEVFSSLPATNWLTSCSLVASCHQMYHRRPPTMCRPIDRDENPINDFMPARVTRCDSQQARMCYYYLCRQAVLEKKAIAAGKRLVDVGEQSIVAPRG